MNNKQAIESSSNNSLDDILKDIRDEVKNKAKEISIFSDDCHNRINGLFCTDDFFREYKTREIKTLQARIKLAIKKLYQCNELLHEANIIYYRKEHMRLVQDYEDKITELEQEREANNE